MDFRNWIENQSAVTKLAIFDFDKTLADTQEASPDWKATPYVAPDGKVRDDNNWWTHPDSLGDFPFNPTVLAEFKKAKADPNTRTALLTGRSGMRTAHIIRGKLRQQGLFGRRMIASNYKKALSRAATWPNSEHPTDLSPDAHEEYFAGDMRTEPDFPQTTKGNPAGDTFSHKRYVIEKKLMNNNIQQIDFWDDRDSHLNEFLRLFQEFLQQWPNLEIVNFHRVKGKHVEIIPLRKANLPT